MTRLRDLINTNVTTPANCRWVTLTYKDNMTDTNKLRYDAGHFHSRCRAKYGRYEYISVAEPQGRGAWHLHMVLIFPHTAPYMANEDVRKLWGKGFVNVRKLDAVDNVGAYLTAYFGDMSLEQYRAIYPDAKHLGEVKIVEVDDGNGGKTPKSIVKGARLVMYPTGMHFYRASRGVKQPEVHYARYGTAKQHLGDAALTYQSAVQLTEGDFSNILAREIYNTKRKRDKEE
jgi:hypothetical protein